MGAASGRCPRFVTRPDALGSAALALANCGPRRTAGVTAPTPAKRSTSFSPTTSSRTTPSSSTGPTSSRVSFTALNSPTPPSTLRPPLRRTRCAGLTRRSWLAIWRSGAPWPETLVINLAAASGTTRPSRRRSLLTSTGITSRGIAITGPGTPSISARSGGRATRACAHVPERAGPSLAMKARTTTSTPVKRSQSTIASRRGATSTRPLRADVDDSFYPPDGEDLRLVREDVLDPWGGNTVRRWRGRLRGRRKQTSKAFHTPLDGTIRVTVGGVRGSDFDLFLKVGRRTVKRGTRAGGDSFTYRICGPARIRVVVKRSSGRAKRFRVRFSRP